MVVGLGPGDRNCFTPEALAAIAAAQVVVGYHTYLDLIPDLLQGKQVVATPMRGEVERARQAVELAAAGKTVAVVSSGDPGIYGMAGLIIEAAGGRVPVRIIPGITAASAAAASLGAPLMNDFAVISLSDLLTPWETMLRRLEAAAAGDFVVVLYNPRSHGRPDHIKTARQIMLKYKPPATPVGIVRQARRGQEQKILTTLGEMLNHEIDMLTTVVIGNAQTSIQGDYMVTARGYKW
ncbi:precorrin-3B C(17)-methyltransferase [Desulforamulus hydrothermalis]|uniref:Cobalt-precorrin-3B C(17)-methyltransferase n=1 Tax=Desulforamulus hydrothermalis Lam5 = DSM 18033 TaxID=1121428 RepID=K8E8Y4_9FIRM|nr:precorrin-3B C(17)-methyltransferase [Desulforamulus hydrothermalis]CCO07978.1 Cobalt-precorrin-3B C(17)-methyltransferase [Desulforamulus hydrothermalis Lam5 = DSM 18033]SHG84926.1 precorrin-3B C17-methyltransferase [Desulforamulus hydrothermalis Lam5 = DSM 18033]